jgi:hypothetical protein
MKGMRLTDYLLRERERFRHENKNLKKVIIDRKIHDRIKLGLMKYGFDVVEREN